MKPIMEMTMLPRGVRVAGLRVNIGSMVKPLHSGFAARDGSNRRYSPRPAQAQI